jgi:PAS domain S-box-containing protein
LSRLPLVLEREIRETKLRRERQKYQRQIQAVFAASQDLILIIDDTGQLTHANPAASKLFGISEEALLQKHATDFFASEWREPDHRASQTQNVGTQSTETQSLETKWRQFINQPHSQVSDGYWKGEISITLPNGSVKAFDYSMTCNFQPGSHLAVLRDITERQQAEQALRENEERFRTLADNMPNLAFIADAEGNISWYNSRWYEYTGTTPEQTLGWGWEMVHDPQQLPQIIAQWQASIETGQPYENVSPMKGADGKFRPFLTRVMAVKDEHGQVIRWFGTSTDVSRQHEIEAALRSSESRLQRASQQQDAMAGFSLQAMSGMDDIAEITRIAVQMVALTLGVGYSKVIQQVPVTPGQESELHFLAVYGFSQDLVGQKYSPSGEPHSAYTLKAQAPIIVEDVYQETRFWPSPLHYEYSLISGMAVVLYVHGQPYGVLEVDSTEKRTFTDAEVNFLQTVATLIGIVVERKLHEEALARQYELTQDYARRLEISNKDLSHFASVVSHDLQAPLRKLLLFGDLLQDKEKEKLSAEGKDYIARMQRSIFRMQALITDLLALARVDQQTRPFAPLDFREVVSNVLEDLAPEIHKTNAVLTCESMCAFEADRLQIAQLITNLVDNALKYRRSELAPEIHIGCTELETDTVRITVTDNGIGIRPEHYEKIFEIFQRLHSEQQYSGTGIGLAIVKRIVDRHRGTITVESKPGESTQFTITLPVHALSESVNARATFLSSSILS